MAATLRILTHTSSPPIYPILNGPKRRFAGYKCGSRKALAAQMYDKKENMINLARLLSNIFFKDCFFYISLF